MTQEYTLAEMIDRVSAYLRRRSFSPERYSDRLYNIRLPIYCVRPKRRGKGTKAKEQIVVDIITESHISVDAYMRDRHFGEFMVPNASSVKFFQYYIPEAKVFWAYGHYVNENDEDFGNFKKCCAENGIGLLRVSERKVEVVQEGLSLKELLRRRVVTGLSGTKAVDQSIINAVSKIISDHQREYIQYLVFYGEPRFLRRAITVREEDEEDIGLFLSMFLINKLGNIQNLAYADRLKNFIRDYMYEKEDDRQISFRI